ncbi:glutathione S-transferase family protein [Marinobacterium aestuariivivens]|uniref:Glutathione S-transferase family protein n=1 Tax=Marinobacterium aestuariivivens TaxID=1698799 RepID=A0ABW2A2Q1_9GAMM
MAGNDLSYADLVLFYCMRLVLLVARTVYQWNPLDEEPELAAWMARVEARDHSQSVLADQKQSLDALRAQQS